MGWSELCRILLRSKNICTKDLLSVGFLSVQELYGRFSPSASRIRPSSNMCGGVVRDQRFLNWGYKKQVRSTGLTNEYH